MVIINLSIEQLSEVVRNLDADEKDHIRQLLEEDEYVLSPEQEKILLERDDVYERGEMEMFTVDELKARLNFKG